MRANTKTKGFTLIELLVAIGIFSVVVIIVAGAITSVISANRQAQVITSVVNNLNFTLESMTRAVKTGSDLVVAGGSTCGDSVSLTDARGRDIAYSLASTTVALTVNGVTSPITAPEIKIKNLEFCSLAGNQPAVLFTVSGLMELAGGTARSEFHVQTTVAQRGLQIPTS